MPTRRTLIIINIFCASLAAALLAVYLSLTHQPATTITAQPPSPIPYLSPTPIPTPPPNSPTLNIALLGYGGAGHQGGYLTDVIQIVHFNFQRQIIAFISIPRDLFLTYPDGVTRKINAAYVIKSKLDNYPKTALDSSTAKSAATTVKTTLETITGLPITYFIGVDFNSFQNLIDHLGGIKVSVTTPLNDQFYPIKGRELELCGFTPEAVTQMTATMSGFTLEKQFTCRYEPVRYDPGTYQMTGEAALKFARSRHSSSDFDRSLRQQAILTSLKDKLITLGALDNLTQIYTDLSILVKTDLDIQVINHLTPAIRSLGGMTAKRINLNTSNVFTNSTSSQGAFIVIPKAGLDQWPEVHAYIRSQLNQLLPSSLSPSPLAESVSF